MYLYIVQSFINIVCSIVENKIEINGQNLIIVD